MAAFHAQYMVRGTRMTVRSAEPDDAPALIAMVHQLDRETTFLAREPGEFDMTEARERDFLQGCKESERCLYLVAVLDGVIVGNCNAVYGARQRYRHVADISVGVLKPHWGQGIGRILMRTCIDWLQACGVEKVELAVDTQNLRAIPLYLKLGFVIEGVIRHDRKLADGSYRDAYRMALDLLNTRGTKPET